MFWIKDIKAIFINYYFFFGLSKWKTKCHVSSFSTGRNKVEEIIIKKRQNKLLTIGRSFKRHKITNKNYAKKFGYCLNTKVK